MNTTPVSLLERLRRPHEQAAWERFVRLYTPLLCQWARRLGLRDAGGAGASWRRLGPSSPRERTMATTSCPDQQQLERLLLGQLPDAQAERLEEHVSHCGDCLRTVRTLRTDDTLVEAVRAGWRATGMPADAADEALRRRYARGAGIGRVRAEVRFPE